MQAIDKKIKLYIDEIHPNLRFINLFQCNPGYLSGERLLYDYYFLYVHKGKGTIVIGENKYDAATGDLFFCSPGVLNSIYADDNDPFLLTGINFDFTQNHRSVKLPFPIQKDFFQPDKVTEYVEFVDFEGFSDRINLIGETNISGLIYKMIQGYREQKKFWDLSTGGMLQTFIITIIQCITQKGAGSDWAYIGNGIIKYVSENYMHNITNQTIAERFHYHPDHINRIVLSYTGMTLKQYIINLRIRKAIDLLINTDADMSKIASSIGYESVYYFSRIFRKKVGYAPTHFRKLAKNL